MTPTHTHDCGECRYHGTIAGKEGDPIDLYSCHGSVIARDGSDGPDYRSLNVEMAITLDASDPLRIAAQLAG